MLKTCSFDISKTLKKVWHKLLLHKLFGYGISRIVSSIIKSFLTSSSLHVIVDNQSTMVQAINTINWVRFCPTLFLFYIKSRSNSIFRSFVNIYSDETPVSGCISKILETFHERHLNQEHSQLAMTGYSFRKVLVP